MQIFSNILFSTVFLKKKKKDSLSEASLLVLDFTISVLGSSCNYLFLGLILAP